MLVDKRADDRSTLKMSDTTAPRNVTIPVTLDSTTGEVSVKKASGKVKVRRGQTPQEYETQRDQFWAEDSQEIDGLGLGWMGSINLDDLLSRDMLIKQERQKVVDYLSWLYYHGRTDECLQLIKEKVKPVFTEVNTTLKGKMKKEMALLETLSVQCQQQ